MLGILNLNPVLEFFTKNSQNKNQSNGSNSSDLNLKNIEKKDSIKILNLKELIVNLESFLPTNSNHLNPTVEGHLDEIKNLRDLVSDIKKSLSPCYEILKKSKGYNFNFHDSITSCDMILGLLQQWDKNEILTTNENKNLNKVLVIFSRKMHDIFNEIKF